MLFRSSGSTGRCRWSHRDTRLCPCPPCDPSRSRGRPRRPAWKIRGPPTRATRPPDRPSATWRRDPSRAKCRCDPARENRANQERAQDLLKPAARKLRTTRARKIGLEKGSCEPCPQRCVRSQGQAAPVSVAGRSESSAWSNGPWRAEYLARVTAARAPPPSDTWLMTCRMRARDMRAAPSPRAWRAAGSAQSTAGAASCR